MAIEVLAWYIPVGNQPEVMQMKRFVKEWKMNDNPENEYEDSQYYRTDCKGESKLVNACGYFVPIDIYHGLSFYLLTCADSSD